MYGMLLESVQHFVQVSCLICVNFEEYILFEDFGSTNFIFNCFSIYELGNHTME